MPKWKNIFDWNQKIEPSGITHVVQSCDCVKRNEIEVSPKSMEEFCIPEFDEKIIPYQNLDACGYHRPEIQEIETPDPHCFNDACYDHCNRLEVTYDHCDRRTVC